MDANEIIQQAMSAGKGMLLLNGFYIIEGQPVTNELRIRPAPEALDKNLLSFIMGEATQFCFLGLFNNREAAEEAIIAMRTLLRDDKGNHP